MKYENINIDNKGRITIAELSSRQYGGADEAAAAIERMRADILRAGCRKGKEGQWFAVIENHAGFVELSSEAFRSAETAERAAKDALAKLLCR